MKFTSKTNMRLAAIIGAFAILSGPALPYDGGTSFYVDDPDDPVISNWVKGKNQWGIVTGFNATEEGGKSVADAIEGSYDYCEQIYPEEYQIDCLAEQLEEIAKALPPTPDYAPAKKILEQAAQEMRSVVRANADTSKPRVRASGTARGKRITTKPLTAVRPERLAAAKAQAANILEEAETKLLRSAEASDRRLIAYAQMAKAVGSNKTLLRSS